jgi:phosphate transport system substrate-binding protein
VALLLAFTPNLLRCNKRVTHVEQYSYEEKPSTMKRFLLTVCLCAALSLGFAAVVSAQTIQINGAGATFPAPIYGKWFDEYHKAHPNVEINYQAIGSGGGIRQLSAKTVDFGASDTPMTDEQISQAGFKILHFPTVMGAAVPSYNIPGVNASLKFTQKAVAGIFLGNIKKWNDPEITNANPGVNLPAEDIVVIHRSDGSGTTFIWTDFLSKVSPEWKSKVSANASVNWPTGLGGKGSDGVTGLLKQTKYSIGYIELTYAVQNHVEYGEVQNAEGQFVKASLESVSAAAAGAAANMPDDFRVSITNAPGKASYPISSFTWLLIPAQIQDSGKKAILVDFLKWMMAAGQNDCDALNYAKLPAPVVQKEMKAISQVQ